LGKSRRVLVVTSGGLKAQRYWVRVQIRKKGNVIGETQIPFSTLLRIGRGECYPVEGVVGHGLEKPHQWICKNLTKQVYIIKTMS